MTNADIFQMAVFESNYTVGEEELYLTLLILVSIQRPAGETPLVSHIVLPRSIDEAIWAEERYQARRQI